MQQDIDQFLPIFFKHFANDDWQACESILTDIQSRSKEQPELAYWYQYFLAILIDNRDQDYGQAIKLLLQLLDQDLPQTLRIRVLRALGINYIKTSQWQAAITFLQQAVDQIADDQATELARTLHEMAIAYSHAFDNGDFGLTQLQVGVSIAERALNTIEREPPSPPVLFLRSQILNTLAVIYKSLKKYDLAISCLERKIEICEVIDNPFSKGIALGNLGEIFHAQGNEFWLHAKDAYQDALKLIHRPDQWQKEEVDILANLGFLYQDMEQYAEALNYYKQSIAGIEALRSNITGDTARIGYFATVTSIYDHAILLCFHTEQWAEALQIAEQARARAFLEVLSESELSAKENEPILTLAEIQSFLPENSLLVAYYTTGLLTSEAIQSKHQAIAQRHRFPEEKTLIFAITKETITVLDSQISPNLFRSQQIDAEQMLQGDMPRRLYAFLIEPIASKLQNKQLIYFVPHGPLHAIPLHALVAPDGDALLRTEGPLILYTPSASLLFQERPQQLKQRLEPCLAIGYGGDEERPLNQAEPSAEHIAHLLKGKASVGGQSKLEMLKAHSHEYRIIHFACHGLFNTAAPMQSALQIAKDEWLTASNILTHFQINAELIVLSACETGLSQVHRGDELDGFVRAFMQAGTSVVLTTNWRVHDNTTAILMAHFYERYVAGDDPAMALKHAQLFLKSLTMHDARVIFTKLNIPFNVSTTALADDELLFADPIFWAPFTLMVRSQRLDNRDR